MNTTPAPYFYIWFVHKVTQTSCVLRFTDLSLARQGFNLLLLDMGRDDDESELRVLSWATKFNYPALISHDEKKSRHERGQDAVRLLWQDVICGNFCPQAD